MFCENCGKKLEEGSKFCNACGAVQPQPVFCIQCGKKLEPRSLFCNGCGASQTPEVPEPEVTVPQEREVSEPAEPVMPELPEEAQQTEAQEPVREALPAKKKKSKKWIIPAVALVAALAVAAVLLIPALFPKPEETVTIYLLTGRTVWTNGEQTSQTVVEYDAMGRPTAIRWLSDDKKMESTMEYDSHGNRTEEKNITTLSHTDSDDATKEFSYGDTYTYDFEYDEDGRISECTVSRTDGEETEEVETLEFTYDDRGNVILVEYSPAADAAVAPVWDFYAYDEQGRLVQETFCMVYDYSEFPGVEMEALEEYWLYRYTYSYDDNGDLDRLCYSGARSFGPQEPEYDELDDLEFTQFEEHSLDVRNGHILMEGDGDALDENGNPSMPGDTFDEHGNLIREEDTYQREENGVTVEYRTVTEYTYKALELPKSDAQRAQRLMSQCCLPSGLIQYAIQIFGDAFMGWRTRPVAMHVAENDSWIYYYLIPNPIY